jgi:hypothetical protein
MLGGEEAAHLGERDSIVGRQLNQPEAGKASQQAPHHVGFGADRNAQRLHRYLLIDEYVREAESRHHVDELRRHVAEDQPGQPLRRR